MRTAYKCRAYPDPEQVSLLNRTFGCVRVAWNRTLAWRHARYRDGQASTSYAQASAYLTALKATEELGWLNEVSCVPLQQAIRHQQAAFSSFFAGRAAYPRYKSRNARQCAEYTRSGFRYRDGQLFLAKMSTPLAFAWSWPDLDPASIDPSTVTVSRDPCGRWYVAFAVEVPAPAPLPAAGAMVGVDLGIKDFAVTSDGHKIANPRRLARRERSLARYQRRLARCQVLAPGTAGRPESPSFRTGNSQGCAASLPRGPAPQSPPHGRHQDGDARTGVHREHAGQARPAPVLVIARRHVVVDGGELYERPHHQVGGEQDRRGQEEPLPGWAAPRSPPFMARRRCLAR